MGPHFASFLLEYFNSIFAGKFYSKRGLSVVTCDWNHSLSTSWSIAQQVTSVGTGPSTIGIPHTDIVR
jgi:hypothetical protein